MEHALFATHAVSVSPNVFLALYICANVCLDYAKLTRKAGANKAAVGSSNLRPKSPEQESSDA